MADLKNRYSLGFEPHLTEVDIQKWASQDIDLNDLESILLSQDSRNIGMSRPSECRIKERYYPFDNYAIAAFYFPYLCHFLKPEEAPILLEMCKFENLLDQSTYENWNHHWRNMNPKTRAMDYIRTNIDLLSEYEENDAIEEISDFLFYELPIGNMPCYEIWQNRLEFPDWSERATQEMVKQFQPLFLELISFYKELDALNKT